METMPYVTPETMVSYPDTKDLGEIPKGSPPKGPPKGVANTCEIG